MGRKKIADYERGRACYNVLSARLDLDNHNWLSELKEWYALEQIAEQIEILIRYNGNIWINGGIITAWMYWETVKRLEYTPEIYRAYRRRANREGRLTMLHYPLPAVVECGLLQDVYNIAHLQQIPGRPPMPRKYPTDDLI